MEAVVSERRISSRVTVYPCQDSLELVCTPTLERAKGANEGSDERIQG